MIRARVAWLILAGTFGCGASAQVPERGAARDSATGATAVTIDLGRDSSLLPLGTRQRDGSETLGAHGHEPPNFSPIFSSDGRSLGVWKHDHPVDAQFVWDPGMQDTVMELKYGPWVVPPHRTFGPNTHLFHIIRPDAGLVQSIYLRAQVKLSANWVQNPSNVLKIFELFSREGESPIVGIYGFGSNIRMMVANDNGHDPNYAGAFVGQTGHKVKSVRPPPDVFTLDRWHTVEVVLVANTPGISNGRLKTWLDGKLQTDVGDVMWTSAGFQSAFIQFDINALWGGQEGILVAPQFLRIGKIYLSGSSLPITAGID